MIYGARFIDLCRQKYCPVKSDEYSYLQFNVDLDDVGGSVYTHTHYVESLFDRIREFKRKVVVVSHNSDSASPRVAIPGCVERWFCQNVDHVDPRLESIPIGLENPRWFPNARKLDKIREHGRKLGEGEVPKRLLYVNHKIATNSAERREPYDLFARERWCTIEHGVNGQFDGYLRNILDHKFVLSPMGHGIDTHRKWEALHLGSIPVEKRNINNTFYTDLPICLVDDWKEVTEDFLLKEYERMVAKEWNWDKLSFNYWERRIYGR